MAWEITAAVLAIIAEASEIITEAEWATIETAPEEIATEYPTTAEEGTPVDAAAQIKSEVVT